MISLILDCSTKVMFIGLGKKKEIIDALDTINKN